MSHCTALRLPGAPAANMYYFYYDLYDQEPAWVNASLYNFFYPAYRLHQISGFPGFIKNVLDRKPVDPSLMGP
jgi:hypothetical protein